MIFLPLAAESNPDKVPVCRMNILYQVESDLSSVFLMQSLGGNEIEMGRLDPSLSNAVGDL